MGEQKPKGKEAWWRKVGRVLVTLLIWLALALAAAVIVALIPSVRPCFQRGLDACRTAITQGFPVERSVLWLNTLMDWVILLVSLIVAVRIMYPPEDLSVPPQKPDPAPEH